MNCSRIYRSIKQIIEMSANPLYKNENAGIDERLEYLRTVAHSNIVTHSLKKKNYKKSHKRHKPTRQFYSDEMKRINNDPRVPKVTYLNIVAPPSLLPTKKYCDITGLKSSYRSPTNNIRYHNAEIYQLIVKPMAPGVDQEYLKLRGANFVLK